MSAQHTPTPWSVCAEPPNDQWYAGTTISAEGFRVADTCILNARHKDNAAFIVRACNAHDELVAALSDLEDIFDGQEDCDDGVPNDAMRAMTIIRAALAKAGAA